VGSAPRCWAGCSTRHGWRGPRGAPSPDAVLDDLGVLRSSLWADAPSGGQATTEERYDAERLRRIEATALAGGGRRLYAGAVHRTSGRVVGFTEIDVPAEERHPAGQEYTIVLREHRGHALGMRLKVANLRALAAASPGRTAVTTYNAAENTHVLRVNEALGFQPYAASGAWRLDL
jgi:GNAT superfamily N-acetyltransferase